ncbi:glycoside hydrolase family 95 protein [Altererythrobacter lutimaris]|uniref:Glycoside hydrolase family 95 protein n=1 Tax=Altererythrobacter lutimaris TaxID=2743979 RepID=A0A850H909_9SPHN|nr:glycoside hydrolase family 95 protein [Altererythrobacter lutimaris]NVE94363.1 glycoside hydrolase family 95 protein [Altererythrobacter lutimaris]
MRMICSLAAMLAALFSAFGAVSAEEASPQDEGIQTSGASTDDAIVLTSPAWEWEHAYPVGNGRLAAMVFGRPGDEIIQVNEETVWEGGTDRNEVREGAAAAQETIVDLIFDGKAREAEQLSLNTQPGAAPDVLSYQTLGDLSLSSSLSGEVRDYRRYLDLERAAAVSQFSYSDGVSVSQTVFASAADQVIVVHVAFDSPDGRLIDYDVSFARPDGPVAQAVDGHLHMSFRLRSNGGSDTYGNSVSARIAAVVPSGSVAVEGDALRVSTSKEFWLLLAADTEFRGARPEDRTLEHITKASGKDFANLFADHVSAYSPLYDSFDLELGPRSDASDTAARIANVRAGGNDPDLYRLFTQFGRYLLISSSRPGSLPANLQGKWNDYIAAPWNSDYHMNINLQMNYWGAEALGLTSSSEALVDWVEALARNGSDTAKIQYGARGWVAHHTSDAYARSVPDRAIWGHWPLGGAWTSLALAERYRFTQNDEDAERGYAVLKGSAEFILDILQPIPEGLPYAGRLAVVPSQSPENRYLDAAGQPAVLTFSSTGDTQIVNEVFDATLELMQAVRTDRADADLDKALEEEILVAKARLVPMQISQRDGRLMEWIEDYDEADPGHRHISHAFALHPANDISPERTPELTAALRKTIEARLQNGGGGTGWSRAWLANMFARLHEGDRALEQLSVLVGRASQPNLLTTHPPFQIDGNFGGMAAVSEMLMQSHLDEVHLLPALPTAWSEGRVRGLKARGGYTLDFSWSQGRLERGEIVAMRDSIVRLRSADPLLVRSQDGALKETDRQRIGPDWVTSFSGVSGSAYSFEPNVGATNE